MKELIEKSSYFLRFEVYDEVAGFDEVAFGIGDMFLESLDAFGTYDSVLRTPDDLPLNLMLSGSFLEFL